MTKKLLYPFWIDQLHLYDCIHVGFSGGLDSTVLLHALVSEAGLMNKIHAVHINHGLSPRAEDWQRHCQQVCEKLGIACKVRFISFHQQGNIEEEARHARYAAFSELVQENHCLLTAHHQDDQAETVLLHLFRGTGMEGLRGISETSSFSEGYLHRPLLNVSRDDLLTYARTHQLSWIEDESNADLYFSRNFVRQQVLPLLKSRWPSVRQSLIRTSLLSCQAQSNLEDLAYLDCLNAHTVLNELSIKPLMGLSEARLLNVLRFWLKKNSATMPNYDTLKRILTEVIGGRQDANPEVSWDRWVVRRFREQLYFHKRDVKFQVLASTILWDCFPDLKVLPDLGVLSAQPSMTGVKISPNDQVEIRFRQDGDQLIWHSQTKSLKKLMQAWGIPPWVRSKIPLIYVNQRLAVVVGYAMSDIFYTNNTQYTYDIKLSASTAVPSSGLFLNTSLV